MIPAARLVGPRREVVAVDIQERILDKVGNLMEQHNTINVDLAGLGQGIKPRWRISVNDDATRTFPRTTP